MLENKIMKNLSLYIHIPFCVRKCSYCDFLSAPCDEKTRQRYVDALCKEIEKKAAEFQERKVDTVFFGGGTPSILLSGQIEQIMSAVKKDFQVLPDAEISLEMNPGTVSKEKLETYKKIGINRLSIGLQSANNEELKILGRIHTWEEFLKTWELVQGNGFNNVNVDLMSALPGQTLESYEETLRKVLDLKPEHISAYSLIVEEGTLFYKWFGDEEKQPWKDECVKNTKKSEELVISKDWIEEVKNKKLPDEVTDRQMYEMTKRMLEEQGYYRYEISNYALKGYECKHNIGYWKRKEYLGLGLGAASLIGNQRWSNISDLQTYLDVVKQQEEKNQVLYSDENRKRYEKNKRWLEEQNILSQTDQMEEFMFLGLRMMEGVSSIEFEKQFGRSLQEVYGKQIAKLENQGLLQFDNKTGRYALTMKGIDVSNQVFVEFLFE